MTVLINGVPPLPWRNISSPIHFLIPYEQDPLHLLRTFIYQGEIFFLSFPSTPPGTQTRDLQTEGKFRTRDSEGQSCQPDSRVACNTCAIILYETNEGRLNVNHDRRKCTATRLMTLCSVIPGTVSKAPRTALI